MKRGITHHAVFIVHRIYKCAVITYYNLVHHLKQRIFNNIFILIFLDIRQKIETELLKNQSCFFVIVCCLENQFFFSEMCTRWIIYFLPKSKLIVLQVLIWNCKRAPTILFNLYWICVLSQLYSIKIENDLLEVLVDSSHHLKQLVYRYAVIYLNQVDFKQIKNSLRMKLKGFKGVQKGTLVEILNAQTFELGNFWIVSFSVPSEHQIQWLNIRTVQSVVEILSPWKCAPVIAYYLKANKLLPVLLISLNQLQEIWLRIIVRVNHKFLFKRTTVQILCL